ncbi:MAG: HypC/HybG/HupF family hydrogenase formation chaperone [Clostridiales bacterium]
MCLAVPGVIHTIEGDMALIDYTGLRKKASLRFFPDLQVGDYVLIHAGFVIQTLTVEEGAELVELAEEMDFEGNLNHV